MNLIERLLEMLGFHSRSKSKSDFIGPDVSKAVQRNEIAGERARRALEEIKMSDTIADIVGKMR